MSRGRSWRVLRTGAVPVVFLALAAYFLADPFPFRDPAPRMRATAAWAVDPTPVRDPLLVPEIEVAVYTYRCSQCHKLFPSPPETLRPLTKHGEIPRLHGINNRCFNCHLRQQRDFLVDDKGEPIPFDEPERLCAKCHGPVYRDWTHGVHGRTNGFWNPELGSMRRLSCVACHDPHAPAFASMRAAPGPNTLRMGPQPPPDEVEHETLNPLTIYRRILSPEDDR